MDIYLPVFVFVSIRCTNINILLVEPLVKRPLSSSPLGNHRTPPEPATWQPKQKRNHYQPLSGC